MLTGLICELPAPSGRSERIADTFEAKVSEMGRGVLVRVRGPLDLHYAPNFLLQLRRHTSARKQLVVDLREAQYVDSSGIRALMQMQKDLDAAEGDLRLVITPGGRVERVIKLLQLQSHFQLFPSVADAWSHQPLARAA